MFYIKLKETAEEHRVFRKSDFLLLLVIFSAMAVGIGLPEFGRVFAPYPLTLMMLLLFFSFLKIDFLKVFQSVIYHIVGLLVTWGMKKEGDCSGEDRWTPHEMKISALFVEIGINGFIEEDQTGRSQTFQPSISSSEIPKI